MKQIYLLSILFTSIAGYIIVFENGKTSFDVRSVGFSLKDEKTRLILGILSICTGFLKLLSPVQDWIILGDLLPALAGGAVGLILVIEYYSNNTAVVGDEERDTFKTVLYYNKKIIGIAAIIISAIHFIFADTLFL